MKTPTLIVRLVGLYLLTTCGIGLHQIGKMQGIVAMAGGRQGQSLGDFGLYLWGGVIAGAIATLFAGRVACLLTFDSEPSQKSVEM